MTRPDDPRLVQGAVQWLLRLPLLGANELGLLLGSHEVDASAVLRRLEEQGWTERFVLESPEVARRAFFALSPDAVEQVMAPRDVGASYPVARQEIWERVLRLETTAGLNLFLARLARSTRCSSGMRLSDVRSLPWARRRAVHWWPPAMEAHGSFQNERWTAPFFVAWDRVGAPGFHRRARVRGWYAFRERAGSRREALPNVLILCPGRSQACQWERSVMASADWRGCEPLHVVWAPIAEALDMPASPIWRRLGGERTAPLAERLEWTREDLVTIPPASLPSVLQAIGSSKAHPSQFAGVEPHNKRARLARLAFAAGANHTRLLEWLGHHPFLTAEELRVLTSLADTALRRILDDLLTWQLIQQEPDGPAVGTYFMAKLGLDLLAARDGIPVHRFGKHGKMAAASDGQAAGQRLAGLRKDLLHTRGANEFFVRLVADSQRAGGRLTRWLSPAESTEWFSYDGSLRCIRPDGCGGLNLGRNTRHFFLEWDRGTVRGHKLTEKFETYAAYYVTHAVRHPLPDLLIVTTSTAREQRLWNLLNHASQGANPSLRLATSTFDILNKHGPLGQVWLTTQGSKRGNWPRQLAGTAAHA